MKQSHSRGQLRSRLIARATPVLGLTLIAVGAIVDRLSYPKGGFGWGKWVGLDQLQMNDYLVPQSAFVGLGLVALGFCVLSFWVGRMLSPVGMGRAPRCPDLEGPSSQPDYLRGGHEGLCRRP
jgi:hypothetical protein